ncbi:hypothetical protein C3F34_14180 [Acinetobacter sp. ACNIH2]|uniref:hypothetical protein n=1 Tax=Acinetobacter sp. ACNIH2 TaxID=1758189 RepID=UPI000CDBF0F8|nr:hypothetical protein [Acinetobacter sp. ACNIH2]AUX87070.1 hypothetical protein C3F34_14180 [Acinetobacter sp. ACNIH2]
MEQSTEQVKSYDAGDIADAHALAESHLSWIATLVSTVKQNLECGKVFHNQTLLEITQYLAESFVDDHKSKSEQYEAESNIQS